MKLLNFITKNFNMKNILLIILFSFFVENFFAQDTITKNNSEKIIAKILEISSNEVRFKKFDFQDGPTYIEKKSDIKMIVYSNGVKEVFEQKQPEKTVIQVTDNVDYYGGTATTSNKIEILGRVKFKQKDRYLNERNLQNVLIQTKDKQIIALVTEAKTSKAMQYIGFAAIPLGIIGLGLIATSPQYSYSGAITYNDGMLAGGTLCLIAAVACPITSGVFKKRRLNDNREAIKLYNQKF